MQKASINNINEHILLGRPWSPSRSGGDGSARVCREDQITFIHLVVAGGGVDLKLIGVAFSYSFDSPYHSDVSRSFSFYPNSRGRAPRASRFFFGFYRALLTHYTLSGERVHHTHKHYSPTRG